MHTTQMSTVNAESYCVHCLSLQPTPSITRSECPVHARQAICLSGRVVERSKARAGRAKRQPKPGNRRPAAPHVQNRRLRRGRHGVAGARAEPPGAAVQAAVPVPALPPHHAPARALRLLHRPRPPRLHPPPALPVPAQAALPVPARLRRAPARPAHPARALLQPRRLRRSGPPGKSCTPHCMHPFTRRRLAGRSSFSRCLRDASSSFPVQAMMIRNDRSL